jgi:hypothetical protein
VCQCGDRRAANVELWPRVGTLRAMASARPAPRRGDTGASWWPGRGEQGVSLTGPDGLMKAVDQDGAGDRS